MKRKTKALVLFSGGLDSMLAVKVLQEQNIDVTAVCFRSCFFNEQKAKKAAKEIGVKLIVKDFSKKHLMMVKNPKHGYGKNMNPCIDCHLMMIQEAGKMIRKSFWDRFNFNKIYDFVATGEVLGQRPMSQNKNMLNLIEKKSGIKGHVLRPLCAKLLPETEVEKKGLVNREKLLDISGRTRKRQLEMVKEYKIENFDNAGGGCLLTDPEFGKRLKELLEIKPESSEEDMKILMIGRHFWEGKNKIVVGRDQQENEELEKLKKKNDVLIEIENYPAPSTLIRNYENKKISKEILEKGKELTQYYSTKARDKKDVVFKTS